jgi:hypothetical protein
MMLWTAWVRDSAGIERGRQVASMTAEDVGMSGRCRGIQYHSRLR